MNSLSQAALESELMKRWRQVDAGKASAEDTFGPAQDWIISLGGRRALLFPLLKRWFWEDKLHPEEWTYSGAAIGEAILLSIEGVAGIKKLPRRGKVDDWYVIRQGNHLVGPLKLDDLRQQIEAKKIPPSIQVWSPKTTQWLKIASLDTDGFTFAPADANPLLKVSSKNPKRS